MLILKRGLLGLGIGIFMVLFQKYFWSVLRPIFIDGRIDPRQKTFLLIIVILIGIVFAIMGIFYERREIINSVKIDRRKRSVQIGFLIILILIGSLAFSIALEF